MVGCSRRGLTSNEAKRKEKKREGKGKKVRERGGKGTAKIICQVISLSMSK